MSVETPLRRVNVQGPAEPSRRLDVDHLTRYAVDDNGCWIWQGPLNAYGYGQFPLGRRNHKAQAHRAFYEHHRGPIPSGLELDHLCRVRACVNPDHLEPVTHAENLRRGAGIGSQNRNKTHCQRGHPFTPENTIHYAQGPNKVPSRRCRTCNREWRAAKRSVAA